MLKKRVCSYKVVHAENINIGELLRFTRWKVYDDRHHVSKEELWDAGQNFRSVGERLSCKL